MALFWTSWLTYGSGAQWRLELEIDDPPASVPNGMSSVSLASRLYIRTTDTLSDTVNQNTLSGDLGSASSPNQNVVHPSGGTRTLVCSVGPTSVPTVFGSTVRVDVTGAISGYEALSARSIARGVTIPARQIAAPAAPTNVVASRSSDTLTNLTWTRTSPTSQAAPYQNQRVQRRAFSSADGWSAWVNRSSLLGPTNETWSDATTANWRYQYRVVAINSAGQGISAGSNTLATTPSAPSNVQAAKSGSNIVVTWTNTRRVAGGVQVERREDGGTWVAAATLSGSPTSWTHVSPNPAVTHQYRVRATVTDPTLQSGFANSNIVQLAAPPNAPTGLTGPSIRDATEDATWRWTHNPVDSSAQSAFEVRHRVVGSGSWTETGEISSAVSEWVLPADTYDNPDSIEWAVRTWGQHDDPSPWSATASSPTSTRPTVVVNAPEQDATVEVSTLVVEWGYDQAEESAQAGWTVELLDAGEVVVETRSGSGTASTAALTTVLPDDSTWTVRVRVQSSAGLLSEWDAATFDVAYPLPPIPTVALTWDPWTASTAVEVTVPDPVDDEVEAVHVDIWRAIDEGEWELIATGVPLDTTVTDWAPTVAGTNRYRADAVSALPSSRSSDPVELVTPQPGDVPAIWLSGGPGYSQVCRVISNLQLTPVTDRQARVLHQFAGRTYPVEFSGEALAEAWTVYGEVIEGSRNEGSPAREWLDLAQLPGPFLLRTRVFGGVRAHVSVGGITTPLASNGLVTGVRFTATRVGRG